MKSRRLVISCDLGSDELGSIQTRLTRFRTSDMQPADAVPDGEPQEGDTQEGDTQEENFSMISMPGFCHVMPHLFFLLFGATEVALLH